MNVRARIISVILLTVTALASASGPAIGSRSETPLSTTTAPLGLGGISDLTPNVIARWNQLLVSARQEGKLTVVGNSTETDGFYQAFGQEFGINVTLVTAAPSLEVSRILAERQQNLYDEDIMWSGSSTAEPLLEANVLQPFFPEIFLQADVIRTKGWYLDRIPYCPDDPQKIYCTYASITPGSNLVLFYNTDLVPPQELKKIKTWSDLLSPKFRGKIEIGNVADGDDPNDRVRGWALLGKSYWKRFMANDPTVFAVGNDPFAVNALARGQYDFAMFVGSGSPWKTAIAEGLPVGQVTSQILQPRGYAVPGQSLAIFKNSPDPAAAQLFANWILTPAGQAAMNAYQPEPGDVALRTTAPRGTVPDSLWSLARHTSGVFVASNHPNDVNDSLAWWQAEMKGLGIQ